MRAGRTSIRFTTADLTRIRIIAHLGPAAEALFALDMLGHGQSGPAFDEWRKAARQGLGPRAQALLELPRSVRTVAELLPMVCGSAGDHRSRRVADTVHAFYRTALEPYWPRVRGYLETDRDSRGRVMLTNGVDNLLGTLHPQVSWRSPVLEFPDQEARDVTLDGRGLVLVPSLFLSRRPGMLVEPSRNGQGGQPPVMVYAIPLGTVAAKGLWSRSRPDDRALGSLIGRTRAAVLHAAVDGCTTSELGDRLRISAAAASQHTAVLRAAGLIRSRRECNRVRHMVTDLGAAVLAANGH